MDLPNELKQRIFFSFSLKERRQLRLVSKSMRIAVDVNMTDVKKIEGERYWSHGEYFNLCITTVNPYNGATVEYSIFVLASSFPFLLHWIGGQVKSLSLAMVSCPNDNRFFSITLHRIFELLDNEGACPNLMELEIKACELTCTRPIPIVDLLKYIEKRQLKANVALTDQVIPFLRSLSLRRPPHCRKEDPIEPSPSCDDSSTKYTPFLYLFPSKPKIRLNFRNITLSSLQLLLDQCNGMKVKSLLLFL